MEESKIYRMIVLYKIVSNMFRLLHFFKHTLPIS
nr:MAG TPA: hypothetical protein [Caudoviricetes sp.]